MSLSRSTKNTEEAFLRFVKYPLWIIVRHIRPDLFREIAGLLFCSHVLNQQTILDEFRQLLKYLLNLNCDLYDPMFAIQLWLTYSYKKLYQFKDMLYDQVDLMPREVSRMLEHMYWCNHARTLRYTDSHTLSSMYENLKYHSCPNVISGRINYDRIALLPYKELFCGITNHKQMLSQYSLQTEEIKAFIYLQCVRRMTERLPLLIMKREQYSNNCSKRKLLLTGSGAFSKCICCKSKLYAKNMLMNASDDNASNDSRSTVCNSPFRVKCDQSLKMDFVTGGCSSLRFNEKNKNVEGKIYPSSFEMQAISNEASSSSITSSALMYHSTCTQLSEFSHSCDKERVTAEISGSRFLTADSNGENFKMRCELFLDMSNSLKFSGIDFEIESIENTAPASILSDSVPSQTRKFLSTTLTSTSSDDSMVSETSEFNNEHTDDEEDFTKVSEFDCDHTHQALGSDDDESDSSESKYADDGVLNLSKAKSIIFQATPLHGMYADNDLLNANNDESIVSGTIELDSRCADDEMSYSDYDTASETSWTLSPLKLFCDSQALDKQAFILNWVDESKESLDKSDKDEEYFKDIDFESHDSNSDVESSLFDRTVNLHDMPVTSQRHKKYLKIDKTFSPKCKSDESSCESEESEEVQDLADKPKRACKVTFARGENLVTVRVFEREPEELLPDPYELDRIRFQMRIHSFSLLFSNFLTTEHRAKILQRHCFYENEL